MTKAEDPVQIRRKEKIKEVIKRLKDFYPEPQTALDHTNALELLVATILSAQATDKLVNTVTPTLFKKYKTAKDYASVPYEEFDKDIARINFHKNKAKNVQAMAKMLLEKYNGEVPDTLAELVKLPGVGRKTANVVLGNIWHKAEGVVVDTHVARLSKRLGLTDQTDPVKIEQDLMKIIPQNDWIDFSHMLIYAGREYYPAGNRKQKPDGPLDGMFID